eukprot:5737880-Amphidinium_carterae.2
MSCAWKLDYSYVDQPASTASALNALSQVAGDKQSQEATLQEVLHRPEIQAGRIARNSGVQVHNVLVACRGVWILAHCAGQAGQRQRSGELRDCAAATAQSQASQKS